MVFQTARLLVRPLQNADLDAFCALQADDEVMRYVTGAGLEADESRRQLDRCVEAYSQPGNQRWVWAVAQRADAAFIGTCALIPSPPGAELGYRLLRRCWGQGYGRELCEGLIAHAIRGRRLPALLARCDVRNTASVQILERSALRFVGLSTDDAGNTDRLYRWAAAPQADTSQSDTSPHPSPPTPATEVPHGRPTKPRRP